MEEQKHNSSFFEQKQEGRKGESDAGKAQVIMSEVTISDYSTLFLLSNETAGQHFEIAISGLEATSRYHRQAGR
jgi:hypothetical protein